MTAAYLAGLFDGEGCLRIQRRPTVRPCFLVAIVNTHLPVLKAVQKQWGGSIHPLIDKRGYDNMQGWQWKTSGPSALKFVRSIAAHSVVKRKQINLWLIAYAKISARKPGERDRAYEERTCLKLRAMKFENFPLRSKAR